MEKPGLTCARPIARTEIAFGIDKQSLIGEAREWRAENPETVCESFAAGVIVDSWVESAKPADACSRLILQVAPRGHPTDLVIVEAEASLVGDRFWLEDLGENLCHGTPVVALGSRSFNGRFAATELQLTR